MKNIIKMIIILIVCFFTGVYSIKASTIIYNTDGTIQLYADDLTNLKAEEYSKVTSLTIKNEMPSENSIDILEQCHNIETIYISLVTNGNLSVLNDVTSTKGIRIYVLTSYMDFNNINNKDIIALNVANSVVENYKDVENLTNLEQIGVGETKGYEALDFTKFPNLTSLTLNTYIEDFNKLLTSIPNVTSLSLSGSNIQNKDTIYLEKLTNLKELYLNQTYLTDIDFVEKLPNLEFFNMPWSIVDLSPIYKLTNLKTLHWEAYTELSVTKEFVDYLDSKGISHYDYNPKIKEQINNIVKELKITSETNPKEAMKKISYYIVENTEPDINYLSTIPGTPSALDAIITYNKGVCYDHSIALYTIAKAAGIQDVYGVSGILYIYMNAYTGQDDGNAYGLGAHAWNIIDYKGTIYSVDVAQMNDGTFEINESLFNENFWKNPFKDDDYDLDYAYNNYLDFNYYYSKRHEETDGILNQVQTFQFKSITGLDIKNHTIYEYDTSDTNASKLCAKVLDNYTCHYEDTDLNGKISTGDSITIKKGNTIVETFTISTSKWVKEIEPILSGVTIEYENYPDKEIDGSTISTLYYNKENGLYLKLKGENYKENKEYTVNVQFASEDIDYKKAYTFTGKEINSGLKILFEGGLLIPKEKPEEDLGFGTAQYIISIFVEDKERSYGLDYIIEEEVETPKTEEPKEDEKEEKPLQTPTENNPNTSDRKLIFITISSLFSLFIIAFSRKQLKLTK